MKKTILYICMLFVLSCQNENKDVSIIKYFDSEVFVENEIKELSKKNLKATKEITLNGKKEVLKDIKVDSSFLYREFELFREANINKSALLGKYKMDTFWFLEPVNLVDKKGLEFIKIDSLNTKLKTKRIMLYSTDINDLDVSFSADLESENFMHSYYKTLIYTKGYLLEVKAREKTLFQDAIVYETKVRLN